MPLNVVPLIAAVTLDGHNPVTLDVSVNVTELADTIPVSEPALL